jgi:hypothetical protein
MALVISWLQKRKSVLAYTKNILHFSQKNTNAKQTCTYTAKLA